MLISVAHLQLSLKEIEEKLPFFLLQEIKLEKQIGEHMLGTVKKETGGLKKGLKYMFLVISHPVPK
jgi:hypothetical protein